MTDELAALRAEVAVWRRNFPRPDEPLNKVCKGTCVYECQWIGCDVGCNSDWRTNAYLWARLTEIYIELDALEQDSPDAVA